MTALLERYQVVLLLVLFIGVLFWAFRPGKRKRLQRDAADPADRDERR